MCNSAAQYYASKMRTMYYLKKNHYHKNVFAEVMKYIYAGAYKHTRSIDIYVVVLFRCRCKSIIFLRKHNTNQATI